ncbi:MAG: hypothetical protein ABWK01_02980 [Infirmifilum sp.]
MSLLQKVKLKLMQIVYETTLKRSIKLGTGSYKWKKIDEELAVVGILYQLPLLIDSQDLISKLFQPFVDVVALLAAITFGIGILGFVLLVLDAALSWITGGSFGRSLSISKFIRAVETLAVIPILFFIISILNSLGVPEIASVSQIMDKLLRRGWQLILSSLSG